MKKLILTVTKIVPLFLLCSFSQAQENYKSDTLFIIFSKNIENSIVKTTYAYDSLYTDTSYFPIDSLNKKVKVKKLTGGVDSNIIEEEIILGKGIIKDYFMINLTLYPNLNYFKNQASYFLQIIEKCNESKAENDRARCYYESNQNYEFIPLVFSTHIYPPGSKKTNVLKKNESAYEYFMTQPFANGIVYKKYKAQTYPNLLFVLKYYTDINFKSLLYNVKTHKKIFIAEEYSENIDYKELIKFREYDYHD